MTAILEFRALAKTYGLSQGLLRARRVVAVDGVDLLVAQGETMGLVGESGCGKSTLARLAVRLERPSSGRVFLAGRDIWLNSGSDKSMPGLAQMVFQDPYSSLDPRMSIGQSVGEGLLVQGGGTAKSRRDRVGELLDMVGLAPEYAKRYPHQFSGGQRQRAAMARALALNPKLVVCDEPVSALDVSIQAQVINLLEDLRARLGLTYLFISHDLSVVGHLCDKVAVMYAGRLVELALASELCSRPVHPYTRMLMDSVPLPDPRSREGLIPRVGQRDIGDQPACAYASRCADFSPECLEAIPEFREVSTGHYVRCRKA